MFFLEDKADVATKVFIENLNSKIMSYQELNQIIKVFDINLEKHEKKQFISPKSSTD